MKERYNSSFMDVSFILKFCKLLICFHHVAGLYCIVKTLRGTPALMTLKS